MTNNCHLANSMIAGRHLRFGWARHRRARGDRHVDTFDGRDARRAAH
jgi:hypothetical protein